MLVSQHFTVINPCYSNQRSAETGPAQSFGSGGAWRSHYLFLRVSYVTGWALVPAREPRQSLTWRRIIRWCFKSSHSVSVALFLFKCCHSQTLCCFHPIALMLRNLHLGAPVIFLPSSVLVCILHHMLFLDGEGVGFEFLSSSDTMRQPVLAFDFLFFFQCVFKKTQKRSTLFYFFNPNCSAV